MKSPVWRALALFTLAVLVVGMAADANAARRSSFAGNYFIDDADDMFAFPQLYAQYQNMAIIDMGQGGFGGTMNGNASLVWGGENHTLRFSTGRADLVARTALFSWGGFDRSYHSYSFPGLGGFDGLFENAPAARNLQFWDLGWATMLGEMPFGVAFSWVSYSQSSEDGADPDPDVDESFNNFGFQFGLTPVETLQLAAEVGFGSWTDDVDDQNDFSTFNLAITGRGDIEDAFGFDWRYLVGFANGSWSPDADGAEDVTETAFRGSFGPVFGDPGAWEVAGYMTIDYMKTDFGNDVDSSFLTIPGYNIAGEYYVNDWFVFRAGVASAYTMVTENFSADEEDKSREYMYMYTAGFGIDKGSFGVDFALEEGELHSGYFLNGDIGDDAFAFISAWFNW